ncbi:MAG: DUF86 domain-containing protein [Candidatus Dadabacteria bacterium]|nr:DUF86 domain-containing protein [Candidatus Dadabacteria bacterium]
MSKDDVRLRHMLDAACEALSFAKGKNRNDLDTDRMLALSLVKCIEIVGEAAKQITEETAKKSPSIKWKKIKGMRNRLVHAYFDINLDVLWQTVEEDLPKLVEQLETTLERLNRK